MPQGHIMEQKRPVKREQFPTKLIYPHKSQEELRFSFWVWWWWGHSRQDRLRDRILSFQIAGGSLPHQLLKQTTQPLCDSALCTFGMLRS